MKKSSSSHLSRDDERCGLVWSDIVYDIPLPKAQRKAAIAAAEYPSMEEAEAGQSSSSRNGPAPGFRRILNGVSGSVKKGEMMAILGASGAGKSTLLNILSARMNKTGELKGNVTFQNQVRDPASWRRTVAYVEQDDQLFHVFTVQETLEYAARLRLPAKYFTAEQKRARVDDTIDMLRLEKCRYTKIGNTSSRGVSGGERKRTSIAVELVSDSSLLMLDEPTSGLDSFAAASVVENLREVTRTRDLACLMTIHQPSWYVLCLFDRVQLMAQGCIYYDGPPHEMLAYMESLDHTVPLGINPVDHFIALAENAERNEHGARRVQGLIDSWQAHLENEKRSNSFDSTADDHDGKFRYGLADKIEVLAASPRDSTQGQTTLGGDAHDEEERDRLGVPRNFSRLEKSRCNTPMLIEELNTWANLWHEITREGAFSPGPGYRSASALGRPRQWPSKWGLAMEAGSAADLNNTTAVGSDADLVGSVVNLRKTDKAPVDYFRTWPNSWWLELFILTERQYKLTIRDHQTLIGVVAQTIAGFIIVGFAYFRLGMSQSDVLARVGVLFFIPVNSAFAVLFPVLCVFPMQRAIMMRERASGTYRTSSFFLSKMIVETPNGLIQRLIFCVVLYFMIGLRATATAFFVYMGINFLQVISAVALGLAIGSASPTMEFANVLAPLVNGIFLLFGGTLLPAPPPWFSWLHWISPLTYAFSALSINEFTGMNFPCLPTDRQCYHTGLEVLQAYNLTRFTIGENSLLLLVISVAFSIVGYVGLRITGHPHFRYL